MSGAAYGRFECTECGHREYGSSSMESGVMPCPECEDWQEFERIFGIGGVRGP